MTAVGFLTWKDQVFAAFTQLNADMAVWKDPGIVRDPRVVFNEILSAASQGIQRDPYCWNFASWVFCCCVFLYFGQLPPIKEFRIVTQL